MKRKDILEPKWQRKGRHLGRIGPTIRRPVPFTDHLADHRGVVLAILKLFCQIAAEAGAMPPLGGQ